MRSETAPGLCPFCLDPILPSKTKPRKYCGAPECLTAYNRCYQRDRRRRKRSQTTEKNMATKKAVKKKIVQALAKQEPQQQVVQMEPLRQQIWGLLQQYSEVLSQPTITPTELASTYADLQQMTKLLDDGLVKMTKQRLVALLKEKGRLTSEKGSMELLQGGWLLKMRPWRTGLDPKKVEATLRAQGKEPEKYMTTLVSLGLPPEKTQQRQVLEAALGDARESCRYDESWSLETPKRFV